MARYIKIVVALLCVGFVIAICIAPNVALPVTIIKPVQVALLLLTFALIAAAFAYAGPSCSVQVRRAGTRTAPRPRGHSFLSPVEAHCVQQC